MMVYHTLTMILKYKETEHSYKIAICIISNRIIAVRKPYIYRSTQKLKRVEKLDNRLVERKKKFDFLLFFYNRRTRDTTELVYLENGWHLHVAAKGKKK